MTLRRKMGLQISAMIVGLLLVSATGLWGLNGLRTDYRMALDGYDYVRRGYEVGTHLSSAKMLLALDPPQRALALREVGEAEGRFHLMQEGANTTLVTPGGLQQDRQCVACLDEALAMAVTQLKSSSGERPLKDIVAADDDAVNVALDDIRNYTADIRGSVQAYQHAAEVKRHTTLLVMAIVGALAVLGGAFLGAMQYLGVVRPLRSLSDGVRRVAAGQFAGRLQTRGGDELSSLAHDFNRMAQELDGFYHQLEEKVAQKSNQLVRSERLASVGYLAAGVAHEINNPLGIIAGYAEYSREQLKQRIDSNGAAGEADADLIKSLQVISDEAFRCKDITGKLLSLARQGNEIRQTVCLPDVCDKVVSIIGGLREFKDRALTVVTEAGTARQDLCVSAVEAEMQQVMLNLALNALEATCPTAGQVRIDLARRADAVELSITDNGRGMSAETLARAFEPFFTEKRGCQQAGTGLGLSITHRIIESHGGVITAHSDGPGKGSRFAITLPVSATNSSTQPEQLIPSVAEHEGQPKAQRDAVPLAREDQLAEIRA